MPDRESPCLAGAGSTVAEVRASCRNSHVRNDVMLLANRAKLPLDLGWESPIPAKTSSSDNPYQNSSLSIKFMLLWGSIQV
jgi:hypothetical protein